MDDSANLEEQFLETFLPQLAVQQNSHSSGKQIVSPGSRSPPIFNETESRSGSSPHLPKSPLSETKLWSHYHEGCVNKDHLSDEYVEKCDKRLKRLARTKQPHKMDDENEVTIYLDQNKDFLETYVMENIPVSELQKWLVRKMTREPEAADKKYGGYYTREKIRTDPKKYALMELIQKLGENVSELAISWEITRYICSSIGYDAYRVYKIFPDHPNFVQYFVTETIEDLKFPSRMIKAEPDEISLVLEVAESGTSLRFSKSDEGFPTLPQSLLKTFGKDFSEQANHVMYIPILTSKEKTAYVVEIWRIKEEFDDKDKELSSNLIVWGSLALHYCNLYLDKTKERSMTDFLLDVVKAIFEEMVSLDQLIKRILEFAQKLVNADRSSLFLVDYRNFELVSTVFDLKFEPGQGRDMEKKEIRMPINRGIAGHVALSGETMNIPDAYSDYRFNREVDEATGYKTISILCMPVKVQGKVIGVVQMVNKRNNDNFDHEDEVAFEIFSTFFGLALHHARLYDKIMRKEQKYRVALEVLSYHNTCREHEVEEILKENGKFLGNINDFYLDPYQLDDFQKCKAVISMFDDLFDLSRFNVLSLTRFILTVKKNYRSVPYHNFDHGWSVAQAMYAIIKHDTKKRFDYKMRLALFVACLCHDLDHRGYTNKYMNEIASPLAAMYTTSPLEHHHFNITVTILQQDGHNIFSHLSSEDYKDILRYIRHCILATDLAAFFPNLVKLKYMFNNERRQDKFNWLNPSHRDLAMAISMTSADLSAAAKPWEIQIKTVKVIFEEFYDQGDKERAAGKIPIPMMDRSKPEEQPASQVGFLSQICIPCYTMLSKIIPKTRPMYKMVLKNLNIWKSKAICALEDAGAGLLSGDDVSDIATESETESDDLENELTSDKNNLGVKVTIESKKDEDEFNDCDDIEEIEKITSEMEANWKCIKSDSVSWDEDQGLDDNVKIKCENIWRGIGNTWVDDEGVVTRSNKALKIMIMDTENNDTPKT